MKTCRTIIILVVCVSCALILGGMAQSPAMEHRQAAKGETVINGEINCDTNPQTPTPPCYFIPYVPYFIDGVQP